jgi:small subunit ribosomal protein S15e
MLYQLQADQEQTQKRRTFRKFSYRGVDLDQLLDLSSEQVIYLLSRSIRRPFDERY